MPTYVIPTLYTRHITNGWEGKYPDIHVVNFQPHPSGGDYVLPGDDTYSRIPDIERLQKQRVVVLHAGYPHPNRGLMLLNIILNILRDPHVIRNGRAIRIDPPETVEVYFTVYPYSKQDSRWVDGEDITARSIIYDLLGISPRTGVRSRDHSKCDLVTVADPHFGNRPWAQELVEESQMRYLQLYPSLVEWAKTELGENITILSPGKHERTGYPLIKTTRKDPYHVEAEIPESLLGIGGTIGALDDFLYTGGTLDKIGEELRKKCGCGRLIALITHAVMPDGARRIASEKSLWDLLVVTNTCNVLGNANLHLPKLRIIDISDKIANNI